MVRYEAHSEMLFEWVVRVRTDFFYLLNIPPIYEVFRNYSNGADVMLYDDHMSIGPRSMAVPMLVTPQEIYRNCPNAEMWLKACRGTRQLDYINKWLSLPNNGTGRAAGGTAPCCPLNLIAWYDDVVVRPCGFIQGGACLPHPCSVDLARGGSMGNVTLARSCSVTT
jgi:hypothetical protein